MSNYHFMIKDGLTQSLNDLLCDSLFHNLSPILPCELFDS